MPKSVATYTYVFQGNELQAPGKIVADVKLVYPNGQISSNKFTFICRPDPLADKNIPAGPYITALQKIVDDGKEKIDYLQALIDTLQDGVGETALTRNDLQDNRDPIDAGLKAIDANMAQSLLLKNEVVNNNSTSTAGYAADARQLNPSVPGSLAAQLAQTNSNLVLKANSSDLLKVKIVSYSVSCGTSQSGTTMPYRSDGVDLTAKSDYPAGTKLIICLLYTSPSPRDCS